MPLSRLPGILMLLTFFTGQLFAQSQQSNTAGVTVSEHIASIDATGSAGVYPPATDLPPKDLPQSRVHEPWLPLSSDMMCYSIRSYLVVRDNPRSDTTHRDGSSTCVPAERFRVYSTVDHGH
jgi:hypothetical protein